MRGSKAIVATRFKSSCWKGPARIASAFVLLGSFLLPQTGSSTGQAIYLSGASLGYPSPRDSAHPTAMWLTNHDLVVTGTIASFRRDSVQPNPQRYPHLWEYKEARMAVRIDRVLKGYSTVRTIEFRNASGFATHLVRPGVRVLAGVTRRPDLPQGDHGTTLSVRDDDVLLFQYRPEAVRERMRRGARALRVQDVPTAVLQRWDVRSAFQGARALVAARMPDTGWTPREGAWLCDSARVIFGSADRLPTWVRFTRDKWCSRYPPAGEFLLPIPERSTGDTLVVDFCPEMLRVSAGHVPALGIRLKDLDKVLVVTRRGTIEIVEPDWSRHRN